MQNTHIKCVFCYICLFLRLFADLQSNTNFRIGFASFHNAATAYMKQRCGVVKLVFGAGEYGLKTVRHLQKHHLSVVIQLRQDVVKQQHRRLAYLVFVDDNFAEFHCKRDCALLSLGRVFATVVAVDLYLYVVTVRTYSGKAEIFVFLS